MDSQAVVVCVALVCLLILNIAAFRFFGLFGFFVLLGSGPIVFKLLKTVGIDLGDW